MDNSVHLQVLLIHLHLEDYLAAYRIQIASPFCVQTTAKQFGFVLVEAKRGKVILKMKVNEQHLQVHGVVHGGVLAALADTAGGLASYVACPPPGTRVATIEMKINYLEAVGGSVIADAYHIRFGDDAASLHRLQDN